MSSEVMGRVLPFARSADYMRKIADRHRAQGKPLQALEMLRLSCEKAPDDVIMMQNFEDGGYNEQLGKRRVAYDYWLSYVGPSETYISTANRAKSNGKDLWAKMQVCCSHELATVPYIPVPGILYDKYITF